MQKSAEMEWGTSASLIFVTLAAGTLIGLAGTDLVLPAIPQLPRVLGGGSLSAQLVIATFVAGTAVGLVLFGAAGPGIRRDRIIAAALLAYSGLSIICARVTDINALIASRFFQGLAASAPSVFAAPILRAAFDEARAIKALGFLGSIEAIAPAIAPPVGAWIIARWGWTAPFLATAGCAAVLSMTILVARIDYPQLSGIRAIGSYRRLLRNPTFVRYAGSQACVLGGLLIFVFGAPWVIVHDLHGTIRGFVWMQVTGIACFTVAANVTAHAAKRIGPERTVWAGTLVAVAGSTSLLIYAIVGHGDVQSVIVLFAVLNLGLGIRGPVGFFRAILAGDGDDERASSLTILAILLVATIGTALLAPLLQYGLVALASGSALIELSGVALLLLLPPLQEAVRTP
jgi:DHA1 family bicyclomycin/chloramphenicol resistance-like MFS transporter